jgi:hypothetical protein
MSLAATKDSQNVPFAIPAGLEEPVGFIIEEDGV